MDGEALEFGADTEAEILALLEGDLAIPLLSGAKVMGLNAKSELVTEGKLAVLEGLNGVESRFMCWLREVSSLNSSRLCSAKRASSSSAEAFSASSAALISEAIERIWSWSSTTTWAAWTTLTDMGIPWAAVVVSITKF